MRATRTLILATAVTGLTACQDLRWENTSVPESQWTSDQAQCSAFARNQSQRRLLARPSYFELWRPGPEAEAARRRDDERARRDAVDDSAYLDRCMRHKGYERVTR